MMPQKGLMAPTHNEQAPGEEGVEAQAGTTDGDESGAGENVEQSAGTEQASPQEEAQAEALMQPVMNLLHGKGAQATLEKLKAGKADLPGAIGMMAAQMMIAVEQAVGKGGGKVEDSVKMEVGQEIVVDLVEIAAAAGLIGDDDESKGALFKPAMMNAIGAYGDMAAKAGLIDRGAAKQMLSQLVQNNPDPVAKNVASMFQQGGQPQPGAPAAPQPGEVQA